MTPLDLRVPVSIASQPTPTPTNNNLRWRSEWRYFWEDLACWRAMKADCYLYGVDPDK